MVKTLATEASAAYSPKLCPAKMQSSFGMSPLLFLKYIKGKHHQLRIKVIDEKENKSNIHVFKGRELH